MNDTITNVKFTVRSKRTGAKYTAQYVIERPAGQYGKIWAWILINTEHGTFIESYKPTIIEAITALHDEMIEDWEKA